MIKKLLQTIIVALVLVGFSMPVTAGTYNTVFGTGETLAVDSANQHNGGQVYYVDGNRVNDDGDGSTWATAYQLLSSAMAASHASIGNNRQWAARNVIYVRGDSITEDFTKMAQKTDIIGVGSNDGYAKAGIVGSWIIPDTTNYMGCRFYNVMFTDAGASAIFDLDTQSGIAFYGCLFNSGTLTTIAVQMEESNFITIENCEFSRVNADYGFSASAIKIVNDTAAVYGIRIANNTISTAGIGIDIDETTVYNTFLIGNIIRATGMGIDDESDDVHVINNRWMTDIDTTTSTAGYDFNIQLSAGNIQMGVTGLGDTVPFAKIAE